MKEQAAARPCGPGVLSGPLLLFLLSAAWLLLPAPVAAEPGPLALVQGDVPAPSLRLAALDGTVPTVPDTTAVVHFFATWCEPCRAELPALLRFAARRPGVPVLLVDVAEPPARVRRFLEALPDPPPPARVLMDANRAAARAFDASLLPATFVVSGGRIALAREGDVAWDDPATDALILSLSTRKPEER